MSITRLTRDSSRGVLGLGLAVFTAATFGTSGTFADSLMATGWTPGAVVTLRISVAAVLLTVPALRAMRGQWHRLRAALPSLLAFGLVAVAGCQLFFFNAVKHLEVGVALLLEYSGILLIVAYLWVRHGHRPRRLTVIGGVAALGGLVLVLNPGAAGIDPIGVLWGLLAATGLATFFVMSSKVDDALPPIALAWGAMVIGAAALIVCDATQLLPFHAETKQVVLARHHVSWMVAVIGLALIATAISYATGIAATRMLGAKLASFVGLTEVLFAVLIAWALLGQAPGALQLIGGVVVLVGIALVRADGNGVEVEASEPALVQA